MSKDKEVWRDRLCGECKYLVGEECMKDEENPFDAYEYEYACAAFCEKEIKEKTMKSEKITTAISKVKNIFSFIGKKKREIAKLQKENAGLTIELTESERKVERLERRIRRMGTLVYDTISVPGIHQIDIEPETIGNYMTVSVLEAEEMDKVLLEKIKGEFASRAAEYLIQNNLMQIFFKNRNEYDPLSQYTTVGAKLFVIPWEQLSVFDKKTIQVSLRGREWL